MQKLSDFELVESPSQYWRWKRVNTAAKISDVKNRRLFYVGSSTAMEELHLFFETIQEGDFSDFLAAYNDQTGRKVRKTLEGFAKLLGVNIAKSI